MFDLSEASESFDRARKEEKARLERFSSQGKVAPSMSDWLSKNVFPEKDNCQSLVSSLFNTKCHTKKSQDTASESNTCAVTKSVK